MKKGLLTMPKRTVAKTEKRQRRWVILRDGKYFTTANGVWPKKDVLRIYPPSEGYDVVVGWLTYTLPAGRGRT